MKVLILGTAISSLKGAPFGDDWEIWGCGIAWQFTDRVNRWFEMHNVDDLRKSPELYGTHLTWLDSQETPTMVREPWKGIKNPEIYPIEEVVSNFGDYFTSTVAYMIGYAMLKGATEIALLGVNMAWSEEYGEQRPGCEHLLGIAKGRGISITLPDTTDLLKAPLYAYTEPSAALAGLDSKLTSLRREGTRRGIEAQNAREALLRNEGAIEALEYTRRLL